MLLLKNKASTFWVILCFYLSLTGYGQDKIPFLVSTQHTINQPTDDSFKAHYSPAPERDKYYWVKFSIDSLTEKEYIVGSPTKWGEATLYSSLLATPQVAGSLQKLSQRSYPNTATVFKINVEKHQKNNYYLRLKGEFSIYTPDKIELIIKPLHDFEQEEKQRYWWQGIFMGIIVIMALYNFVIYLSVHDISYFYYVISILGIGLYFFFYYGFGIELFWQNQPLWDTYSFAFIVPLTNLARIYFTKSYLHLSQYSPWLNSVLNIFGIFCVLILLLAWICYTNRIDWLDLLIDLIGLLGTVVLTIMLLGGILVAQQGYTPAIYFSVANLILVLGGNLFIVRELGWISDNILTRYGVQYGVLAQAVLLSLGLSNRLNQAQMKVTQLELEKERERKQLLEEQSQLLQRKVQEQTADLTALNHLKDKLLSIISHDLRNPLVSLDSFMNLLVNHQSRLSEREQVTLAQKAKQSLANLNQLLSNLLLWSRSQMNQVAFNPQWVDLKQVIQNNVQLHSLDIELKNITIEEKTQEISMLFADAEMLDFIVRNLLGNAIKFSHVGGTVIIATTHDDIYTVLSVKDNGVGMTQKQIQQVQTQPVLTSTRGTAKEKGSGLGLVLCREFLTIHGGKLEIESNIDGTEVHCFFLQPKDKDN